MRQGIAVLRQPVSTVAKDRVDGVGSCYMCQRTDLKFVQGSHLPIAAEPERTLHVPLKALGELPSSQLDEWEQFGCLR